MTDPGHPFSVTLPELIAGLEERIREGVEQPASTRILVAENSTSFALPPDTYAVVRVAGLLRTEYTVFTAGEHYEVRGNRLFWLSTDERPEPGSWLDVDYTYRDRPAGLTDFNPGSVVSTLLRAMAYEMKTLYAQLDEAYRRAFIDQASGVALDNVVALLGVQRKPAQVAEGAVTFFRKQATDPRIPIPPGTRVADRAGRVFVTQAAAGLEPSLEEFATPVDGKVHVTNWIAEVIGVWPRDTDPETESLAFTPDADPRALTIDPPVTAELRVRYRPRSVTVPVEAQVAGPEGNAAPATIVVMPTPPTGIDGITNEAALSGGEEAEPDDQLRERAKHALERAGNATIDAIRFALLGIEGVSGVTVTDHATDETIPLGEVWVRWAGDDDPAVALDVGEVLDNTRAAGVVGRVQRINEVRIAGAVYAIPEPGAPAAAAGALLEQVVATLSAMPIAEPLSLRRLTALAYDVPGLAEVAETSLTYRKSAPAGSIGNGPVTDPFLIEPTEVVRPAPGELSVVLLTSVAAGASTGGGDTHVLTITLHDAADEVAPLTSFNLDVAITVRARLRATPDRPAVPVGRTVKRATFGGDHTATVDLTPADYPAYNADDHLPDLTVTIAAAVYPGLAGVTIVLPEGP